MGKCYVGKIILLLCVVKGAFPFQTSCTDNSGNTCPCGPFCQLCGPAFGPSAPQYHIHSASCGMNDPNGPVYDPVHGFYHMFYQDHLALPNEGAGSGPVYGHAVSRDLTKWARLPVAIWNDKPYDSVAIFTGSATVVNGKMVQMYPGICDKKRYDNCVTGTNFNLAFPTNPDSDPLYHNWTKYENNPVVNNTQRDPSTAWKTEYGEWRLTSYDTTTYGSKDFRSWYEIGKNKDFPEGECPSFFEFPRVVDRVNSSSPKTIFPTHVHKASISRKDWMQVGTWQDGKPGQTGSFTPTPGFDFNRKIIDAGDFYASKDFYDPLKKRRINYGWATVSPGSTLSLPREVVWSQQMSQLLYLPLEEQKALRGDTIVSVRSKTVQNFFATGANEKFQQSEAFVELEIPPESGTFGTIAFAGGSPSSPLGIYFFVVYSEATKACMESEKEDICSTEVGAIGPSGNAPLFKDVLKLSPSDKTITFQIFSDQTFTECYWQGGRVVMTVNNLQQSGKGQMPGDHLAVKSSTSGPIVVKNMEAWSVGSIWVSPEEVLQSR